MTAGGPWAAEGQTNEALEHQQGNTIYAPNHLHTSLATAHQGEPVPPNLAEVCWVNPTQSIKQRCKDVALAVHHPH